MKKNIHQKLIFLLFSFLSIGYLNAQTSFIEKTGVAFQGGEKGTITWADYDNDGDLDILLTGEFSDSYLDKVTNLFQNNGNGVFTKVSLSSNVLGYSNNGVAWGDYNGDNFIDLFLMGQNTEHSWQGPLLIKNTQGTLDKSNDMSANGVDNGDAFFADMDGDGDLDLVTIGFGKLYITYNEQNDKKDKDDYQYNLDLYVLHADIADYNNDGFPDVVVSGYNTPLNTSMTNILKNNGDGTLSKIDFGTEIGSYSSARWTDFNNDGLLDFVTAGYGNPSTRPNRDTIAVYINKGNDEFKILNDSKLVAATNGQLQVADIDNDGYVDILLSGAIGGDYGTYNTRVYHNNQGENFGEVYNINQRFGGAVALADYDNDGDLDFAVNGIAVDDNYNSSYQSKLFENTSAIKNTAPTAPSNVKVTTIDKGFYVSWTSGSDAETPSKTLTYNVAVGTDNVPNLIVPSNSDITTGKLKKPMLLGNAQFQTLKTVHDQSNNGIMSGIYRAYVQTIDNGMMGSTFAMSDTFSIGQIVGRQMVPAPNDDFLVNYSSTDECSGTFGSWSEGYYIPNDLIIKTIWVKQDKYVKKIFTNTRKAPLFTINYKTELTNENVPYEVEYSYSSDPLTKKWIRGDNQPITLSPGLTVYFRYAATNDSLASLIQTITLPQRPSAPVLSIDYKNEQTVENVSDAIEIEEFGGKIVSGTGTPYKITPRSDYSDNKLFTFKARYKATDHSFASEDTSFYLYPRPEAPDFDVNYFTEKTKMSIPEGIVYSTNADMSNAIVGVGDSVTVTPGQYMYFRKASTDSTFVSDVFELQVKARPAVPDKALFYLDYGIENLYSNFDAECSWNSDLSSILPNSTRSVHIYPDSTIYYRRKATSVDFKSEIGSISFPSRPQKPVVSIDFKSKNLKGTPEAGKSMVFTSKINGVFDKFTYYDGVTIFPGDTLALWYEAFNGNNPYFSSDTLRLIIPPVKTPNFSIDFNTETTKQVVDTFTEYSPGLFIITDPNNTYEFLNFPQKGIGEKLKLTPGDTVYFQTAATDTSFKTNIQHLIIPQRPEKYNVSIDFKNETTKEIVPADVNYIKTEKPTEVFVGKNEKLKLDVGASYVFVKAATATSFRSDSVELKVPQRPDAPAFSINYKNKTTKESAPNNLEYSNLPSVENAVIGKDEPIKLTPGNDLYLRYLATDTSFYSDIQHLDVSKAKAPVYTINFVKECTNETISPITSYSTNATMSNAVLGGDTVIKLTPGIDVYFQNAETDTSFASNIQHLVVPSRSKTMFSINFADETTNEVVPVEAIYSYYSDLSNALQGKGEKLKLRVDTTVYFYVAATANAFRTDTQKLEIPARPLAPLSVVANDNLNTLDWEFVAGYNDYTDYEYSLDGGLSWNDCKFKPINVGDNDYVNTQVIIRVKHTDFNFNGIPVSSDKNFTKVNTLINDNTNDQIKLYPIPVVDVLTIENIKPQSVVSIVNVNGSVLYSSLCNAAIMQIDMKAYVPNAYFVRIVSDNKVFTYKIIKTR